MVTIKVKISDDSKEFLDSLVSRLLTGIYIGLIDSREPVVNSIKGFVPVVTGNLQSSIDWSPISRFAALDTGSTHIIESEFFSQVGYARIIDEGLYGFKKRNYLTRGVREELPFIIERIEENIAKEIER